MNETTDKEKSGSIEPIIAVLRLKKKKQKKKTKKIKIKISMWTLNLRNQPGNVSAQT